MPEPAVISSDEAKQKSPEELFAQLSSSPQRLSPHRSMPWWKIERRTSGASLSW